MKNQAFNPILPSYEYIPDGEPYVFDGRVYIYGSHDKFDGKDFCLNNYVTWSAPVDDLSDWRYEGLIYDKHQDPLIVDDKYYMAAPDVQKGSDGRYYLYYFFSFHSMISVAVSDTPAGRYEFYGRVAYKDGTYLGKAKGDPMMFDPGVLVDDDNKVYLYIGFAPKPITRLYLKLTGRAKLEGGYVIELEEDMLTVKEGPKLIIPRKGKAKGTKYEDHEFFEAASIRKYGDTYYFVYSSDKNHELCYATSKSPIGPYEYGGTLISNANIGYNGLIEKDAKFYYGNNHGGMVKVNDKYYTFYHRQTNRREYSRQACAEELFMEKDGSFKQAEMTSCGLNGGPLKGKGTYPTHIACILFSKYGTGSYSPLNIFKSFRKHPYLTQTGFDREDNPDQYIANMRDGATAGFKYFKFDRLSQIGVEVDGDGKGVLEIYLDLDDSPIGKISVDFNSESFQTNIKPISGTYPLYFKYKGRGKINFRKFTLK